MLVQRLPHEEREYYSVLVLIKSQSTNGKNKPSIKVTIEGVNVIEKRAKSQGDHVEKDVYELGFER